MEGHRQSEGRRKERTWKTYVYWTAVILLLILVLQNLQQVEVDFLFINTETPLIFALLIAGALGALIGWATPRIRRDRDRD